MNEYAKRIPGFGSGILFVFLALCHASGAELAGELFAEGAWADCERESLRTLLADDPDAERARLWLAASRLRLGQAAHTNDLLALASTAADPAVRARAGYEVARQCWRAGDSAAALSLLDRSWSEHLAAPEQARLACLAAAIGGGEAAGKWRGRADALAGTWTDAMRADCVAPSGAGPASIPARAVVAFYRANIGPAIGSRCSLEPSCSGYFLQASRRHGLLGVPMIADRLFREPSVVAAARHPVQHGDDVRYADPVSDHDGWLGGNSTGDL